MTGHRRATLETGARRGSTAAARRRWPTPAGPSGPSALRAVADALDAATDELVALAADGDVAAGAPAHRRGRADHRAAADVRRRARRGVVPGRRHRHRRSGGARRCRGPTCAGCRSPLGPVLVFAASNFPFAFSVAGGDTASALAAGCPVVVKAHPGHPATSRPYRRGRHARPGRAPACPAGPSRSSPANRSASGLLRDPRIAAAGVHRLPARRRGAVPDRGRPREVPIPFYAEMGSLNPTFVTPGAVAARGEEIAAGFVGSFTLGVGQFCTKPGLLFLPRGHGLDAALERAVAGVAPGRMLHDRIRTGHDAVRAELAALPGMRVVAAVEHRRGWARGRDPAVPPTWRACWPTGTGCSPSASGRRRWSSSTTARTRSLTAARTFGGNLTATVHAEDDELELGPAPGARAARPGGPDRLERVADRGGRHRGPCTTGVRARRRARPCTHRWG